VLLDEWVVVWAVAARAAGPLCERIRRWLQPVWGLRLPSADYAHNDLNLSNILTDGERITGVVDWDEFGLGSRALDLVALALDCQQLGDQAAADRLLARAAQAAGSAGLRCLVSYRALAGLAEDTREGQSPQAQLQAISAILDRLQAAGP
jgi:aminoglycoside phosphotransferase (APT) family kinase protein